MLLAAHFIGALDLVGVVDRSLPRSPRSVLSVGEVVAGLICSRLCSPSPLYDVAGWASGAAVHELLGIPAALLNDDRLGRALETFAVHSESVRGQVATRAIDRFGLDAGRLHVDLTTLRVTGAYEDSALLAKGWGSDRHVRRQVRALQAATPEGVSVYWRPEPGNASELTLVGQSLERLAKVTGPAGLLVCDSACGNPKTLAQIHDAGLRFVVPLRASSGFAEKFRSEVGHRALRALKYTAAREARLARHSAPSTAAACATGRSSVLTAAGTCRSESHGSIQARRAARSRPPDNAPSPRPRANSSASNADSAAATTPPAGMSISASRRSSAPPSSSC